MNIYQFSNRWHQSYKELSNKSLSESVQYTCLAIILLLVLIVRLTTINFPPLDKTIWKEIDHIYISQNYWQHGFNFFRPEISWPAEEPRVTEMEFPLVPFVAALLYKYYGFNVYTVRVITLLSSLLMILFVFKLTKRELGAFTGLVAAFTAGVLPLYHPFNRILFTEPTMIALSIVSIYYIAEWIDYERRKDWVLALVIFSLTIALKVESLYLILPISWIAFRKYHWKVNQYKGLFILVLLASILPILWYSYAFYLENIGAHLFGIFTGHNKSQTFFMITKYLWYRTMSERIIEGILGGFFGTMLFIIGLVTAARFRKAGLFFANLAAVGIYFVLVAEGNIDTSYRQLPIIPSSAVFVAIGIQAIVVTGITIFGTLKRYNSVIPDYKHMALIACFVLVVIIPTLKYKTIFSQESLIGNGRWILAQKIKKYSNPQTKLIVIGEYSKHVGGYDLSPILYYYSNSQGWTITPDDWNMDKIEALRIKGATLLVVVPRYGNSPNAVNYQMEESPYSIIRQLKMHYSVLYESKNQMIFDLTQRS